MIVTLSGHADTMNSGMSSEVVAAVIGVLLGLFLAQLGRATLAWREVTAHDDEAEEQNARLLIWVDDRTRTLRQHMSMIADDLASRGMLTSGHAGGALAEAKALALHQTVRLTNTSTKTEAATACRAVREK